MTNAISQYGRSGRPDPAVRSSADKIEKKAGEEGAAASSVPPRPQSPGEDSVLLTNVAQKALSEPDFDRAKVESIKQAIAQGQYPLDPRRIAESFVAIERMIRD